MMRFRYVLTAVLMAVVGLAPALQAQTTTRVERKIVATSTDADAVRTPGGVTSGSVTVSTTASLPATVKIGGTSTVGQILTATDVNGNGTWQTPGAVTGVPAGMIAIFDAACPATWTRVTAFDNKFLRGGAIGRAAGGGADTHTHSVDPAAVTSSSNGDHSHTTDPLAVTSTSNGDHSHLSSGGTLTAGAHSHSGTTDSAGAHTHAASIVAGDGASSAVGSADSAGAHTHTFTTSSVAAHEHNILDLPSNTTGAHTHSVDVASTTSSTAGAHTHSVDVAETTSTSSSNVPAYAQVIFCRKD